MENNTDIIWVICVHLQTRKHLHRLQKITLNIEEDLRPGNSSSSICCFCRVPFLPYFNKEKCPCITTRFKMKEKVLIAMRLLDV